MENQENQVKTAEQEEKKTHDYTQLRECIEEAAKKGLSFFFVAADDENVIQVADCKKSDLVPAIAYAMSEEPSLRKLFSEALLFNAFMNKITD